MTRSEVLFIGGRSGVGKSTAAAALHVRLAELDIAHAVIEGDTLDLAHPSPIVHGLAERNLGAVWGNYRALGYRRLVYTNTVSPLGARHLADAMGDDPLIVSVLLRADDAVTTERLGRREQGDELERSVHKSAAAARRLDAEVDDAVHRVDTDGLTAAQVAQALLRIVGWAAPGDVGTI